MHGRDLRQESLGVRGCFRSSSRIVSRISSRQMKRMREVQPDNTNIGYFTGPQLSKKRRARC